MELRKAVAERRNHKWKRANKMGWKDWPYWVKGGVFCFLIFFIYNILLLVFSFVPCIDTYNSPNAFCELVFNAGDLNGRIGRIMGGELSQIPLVGLLLGMLAFFLIGVIIGLIYGKIKNKGREVKQ